MQVGATFGDISRVFLCVELTTRHNGFLVFVVQTSFGFTVFTLEVIVGLRLFPALWRQEGLLGAAARHFEGSHFPGQVSVGFEVELGRLKGFVLQQVHCVDLFFVGVLLCERYVLGVFYLELLLPPPLLLRHEVRLLAWLVAIEGLGGGVRVEHAHSLHGVVDGLVKVGLEVAAVDRLEGAIVD